MEGTMTKIEKNATSQLVLSTLHLIVFIVLTQFYSLHHAFLLSCPLFVFYAILPFIIMRKGKNQEILADERDNSINKKASTLGFASFWVTFSAVVTVILFKNGTSGMIPVFSLLYILFGGMVLIYTVRAVVTLILYRLG
jgi:uncharacterized membrane protein